MAEAGRFTGKDIARLEDRRFLTGSARYIADIRIRGLVDAAFVRSTWAHARIVSVDASAARAEPEVIAVLTASEIADLTTPLTRQFYRDIAPILKAEYDLTIHPYRAPVLAQDRVLRVGEPIAMVIASSRYTAEDGAEAVHIEVEPRAALIDPRAACAPDAEQLHPDVPGNVHSEFTVTVGSPIDAYEGSRRRIEKQFRVRRSIGCPIETRGVIAQYEAGSGSLTVWSNTQTPHVLRSYLSEMLRLREDMIRVIKPDMGGSFGGGIYPEEVAIACAAIRTGRPVRWIEDREENLINSRHSRDQWHDVKVSFDDDGRITSLIDDVIVDSGAYNPFNATLAFNAATHIRNQFDIGNFRFHARNVLTNKQPTTPVRGAGRTEATFVMDRLVDLVAADLNVDPLVVRARNLIPSTAMPRDMGMYYRNGKRLVYDSGDYPAQLKIAVEVSGYHAFRSAQRRARESGRHIGIGISSHVEGSGYGPFEGATVRMNAAGDVSVISGSSPHGQGHETTLAQVCADVLDIAPEAIKVLAGDTSLIQHGGGTFGSRSAVTAGNAVHLAATGLKHKILAAAAQLLDTPSNHLVLQDGRVLDVRQPGSSVTLQEVARATVPGVTTPALPILEETAYFVPPTVTFSSGTHVATVEVDTTTAAVTVTGYWVVDDAGTLLNPMIVDGQQHGGVAHGIGNALLEEAIYEPDGQFGSGSFVTYLLPTAAEIPNVTVVHASHPSPLNPLGVKGTGEGGATSPPAAVINAVADALRPARLDLCEIPLTPVRLFTAIERASAASLGADPRTP